METWRLVEEEDKVMKLWRLKERKKLVAVHTETGRRVREEKEKWMLSEDEEIKRR